MSRSVSDVRTSPDSTAEPRTGRLSVLDRALYALFSRHADRRRHDRDRRRYRSTDLQTSFGVYLSRVYGCSWLALAAIGGGIGMALLALPALSELLFSVVPIGSIDESPIYRAGTAGILAGLVTKRGIVVLGGLHLRWRAAARRTAISRTLPAAVRYLRALAAGTGDGRTMLRRVADSPNVYGETAVAFRKSLNKAALTGSLGEGLRMVARDTPSQDALAPFLLKFHEHAEQGPDALTNYLEMESRMLSHRQERTREQAQGFLELLAELFIVLLVLPALLVIVVSILSVLSPSLAVPRPTPFGPITPRSMLIYGSAGFVLVIGLVASVLVARVRPPNHASPSYDRPDGIGSTIRTATRNPESAVVVSSPLAVLVAIGLSGFGADPVSVVLFGYVAFALPVGAVAARRARLDDAKDREIKDFVHAVSGHVALGLPFGVAVEEVARNVDLGPLEPHVHDLAFNSQLTTTDVGSTNTDLRTAALDRFVADVGTPLAEGTIGLVSGALELGSDSEAVFETLQTEVGRLYHEKKALRSAMLVYVAVGWTTGLLVVGIMVAVHAHVLDGFSQLAEVGSGTVGTALDPTAVQPEQDRQRFYVVSQATMLACGWFAGMASRGRYEALLHSAALVVVAHLVFAGVGMT